MLAHVLDVRGPRIDERHVLTGLDHMGADIAAHRTRSDNGDLPAHTFLPAFWGNANASATRYGLMPASWITFAHFSHVRLDPRLELIRRHGRRLISYRRHFLLEVRRRNRTRDLAVQKIDDLAWRTGGCPDTLRCLLHLAGHTGFFHCRHVGKDRDALCAGHCKRAQ